MNRTMEKVDVIGLKTLNDKAIFPSFERIFNGKYVYQLQSPIDGDSLHFNSKIVPLFMELILPLNLLCSLKWIHFETNGIYCRDSRIDYGQVKISDGKPWNLFFTIPKQMDKAKIMRGDVFGYLIFDRKVQFQKYCYSSKYKN